MPTLLTGSEFNTEKGSRGILLKWLWSKLFPVINQVIPENTVQFSGNSWHYHANFVYVSGVYRIFEIRTYSTLNLPGMAFQIVGVNNFGEISFEWGSGEWDKYVVFNVWWRLRANKNLQTVLAPFPLTKLKIRMGKNLSIFPKPENDLN